MASGKCLDMDGNNGNKVTVFSCFGPEWQNWERNGNEIVNKANGQCLDIEGNDVWVNECNGSEHQRWNVQSN